MIQAVVLSAHTMGLALIRSLGKNGIPIIVMSYQDIDMGHVSKYVKQVIHIHHPENECDQFIDKLISLGKNLGRSILIPADDPTIATVSKNKHKLEEFYIVAAPSWEVTKKFIIKKYTYKIAEEEGIPMPATIFPEYVEEAKIYSKHVDYPCLVKPFESHKYFEMYRRKMTVVNNANELISQVEDALMHKIPVMLQEIIPGDETMGINYNCYRAEGKIIQDFYAKKIRLSHKGFGVPVVVKSVGKIPDVANYTERLLKRINFCGFSCTEYKLDERDNKYKLMEINGRHNRSALLALETGVNFPCIEYNYLAYGKIRPPLLYNTGVYWIDEFRDIENMFRRILKEKYKISDFIRPYFHPHVFAVSSLHDPAPFFKRVRDCFNLVLQKFKKNRKVKQHVIRPENISN
jgi:D-aspartate ligase